MHGITRDLPEREEPATALTPLVGVGKTQTFLPLLRQSSAGRTVSVASEGGSLASMGGATPAYSVSKAAFNALTRILVAECAGTGGPVNAVCPGYTDTDLIAASVRTVAAKGRRSPQEARAHFERASPLGRLVRPEEVADAVVWLTGAGASAVTGHCVTVAGGEI